MDVKLSTPVVEKIPATPLVEYPVTSDGRTEFVTGSHEEQPATSPESATTNRYNRARKPALGIGPVPPVRGGAKPLTAGLLLTAQGEKVPEYPHSSNKL